MTTREKILVAAMVLAVLVGAYMIFSPTGGQESEVADLDRETITQQINAATTAALDGRLTSERESIITSALRPWVTNPFFRPPPVPVEMQEDDVTNVPDPLPDFVYQGYLETSTHQLAMINGRAYVVGEGMKEHGFEVLEINPNRVVIAFRKPSGKISWQQAYVLEDNFYE
jgi:hypothetical protein